ncbi:MAG: 3,4-dihydroxy 2-butanone 4-phosphate synthase / cyclohydrolase [Actinomycetota bacterium]|jgi:3,4-dihydroxy 2-butanone 4-phosphate synthase/GTP cyclohydrolase II|nr:3,4-dihydroxy 2-butanone 4-phosphate synthase / cyclohydrolase [Actinomycetota bacterium]
MTGVGAFAEPTSTRRPVIHDLPGPICGVGAPGRVAAALAAGEPVVLVGDDGLGSLVATAERVTTESVAFLVRHGCGVVFVALAGEACERLWLPPMTPFGRSGPCGAQRIAVDAACGISTGISAADRAHTARLLADPGSGPDDLTRPGHVIPLLARPDRWGSTEAAVALVGAAGGQPAAVSCAVVSVWDPGEMAGPAELAAFAAAHDLELTTSARVGLHLSGGLATRSA